MNHVPNYKKATNAAYELLARYGSFSLATDVFAIAETLLENCKLFSYGQACFFYEFSLETLLGVSEFGFSMLHNCTGQRIILYNEDCTLRCIRFTIAHEIGHYVLKHVNEQDEASEREANCFARNLLCPIPVIHRLGVETVQDYMDVFEVTAPMAMVSLDRQKSDKYHITRENWTAISDMVSAYKLGFPTLDAYYQFLVS